ncbi:transposase [Pseudoalteromonas rubra]|uniref:transposase n=1 Tax=Pseudoalteromonas rubra TaxID=43658 RepID=UPI002016258B|nr:transposase [Pseudoalteromonas rubra]
MTTTKPLSPKLHLAIDANTHQIVGTELSAISIADSEGLSDLLRQLRRKISSVRADGAYDVRAAVQKSQPKRLMSTKKLTNNLAIFMSTHYFYAYFDY